MVKIKYFQYHNPSMPVHLEQVDIDPTRVYDEVDTAYTIYGKCPAWSHKALREFTVYAPKDIKIEIDVKQQSLRSTFTEEEFHMLMTPPPNWEVRQTIQLHIPQVFCWTDAKGVWIELKEAGDNPTFRYVGGWWNLSDWPRPNGIAIEFRDESKPIVIKRGDPLYRMAFYQEHNLNAKFDLVKETPSDELLKQAQTRVNIKHMFPGQTSKWIHNSSSKCPWYKLWSR